MKTLARKYAEAILYILDPDEKLWPESVETPEGRIYKVRTHTLDDIETVVSAASWAMDEQWISEQWPEYCEIHALDQKDAPPDLGDVAFLDHLMRKLRHKL